jgi:hypothetical protein
MKGEGGREEMGWGCSSMVGYFPNMSDVLG